MRRKRPKRHHSKLRATGVVYFAKTGNLVKIGWSVNAEKRIAEIRPLNPMGITLIGTLPGSRVHEKALHNRFRDYRIKGEWFTCTPEIEKIATEGYPRDLVLPLSGLERRSKIVQKREIARLRTRRYRAKKKLLSLCPNYIPALAVVSTYEELIRALVDHRHKLGLTHLEVDDLTGFQDGYTSKLEMGPKKRHGRGLGRLSLPYLLDTYGLRLAVVEKASA